MVLDLVKFIPDFIFISQLDYWCLFYVYTEKAVGSHIKSLRHKKARPPTKTGFQSREITALNAPPPRGPSPVPLMWSRQKRGGPFNASFEEQNDFLFQMLTNYLNKYDTHLPVFLEVCTKWCTSIGALFSREQFGG